MTEIRSKQRRWRTWGNQSLIYLSVRDAAMDAENPLSIKPPALEDSIHGPPWLKFKPQLLFDGFLQERRGGEREILRL